MYLTYIEVKIQEKRWNVDSLKNGYEMLPADHFVCEKNSLHLWVSDMVAALILNDLEKMRQNA